ncbi:MAG TPA: hypothetical protein VKP69_01145 [Isosphaeraceae bacterium]|nr:hypothetical protein [Isosphaeraceae bacterium]
MIAEEFQLRVQGLLDGPSDDGLAHLDGQRLEGIEVDIEPRPFLPVGTPGNNFSPPVRHVAKVGQFLGLTLGERHGVFVLELGQRGKVQKEP